MSTYPFPVDYILERFAFLVEELDYQVESVEAVSREVEVSFRRDKIRFRVWYEWAVLPELFIDLIDPEDDNTLGITHVDWRILKQFGTEKKSYPVHSRIERSFFLVGILLDVIKRREVDREVRKRIDEYAEFVRDNHRLLVEYATCHSSRAE